VLVGVWRETDDGEWCSGARCLVVVWCCTAAVAVRAKTADRRVVGTRMGPRLFRQPTARQTPPAAGET